MRRILTFFSLFLFGGLYAFAGPVFTISELQKYGDYIYFSVGMEGADDAEYTAFQIDIFLPEGINPSYDGDVLEVYMDQESPVYPYTGKMTKTFYHQVSSSYEPKSKRIRVVGISLTNKSFSTNTGNLFDVYVLVDENQGAYNSPNLRMEAMKIISVDETKTSRLPNSTHQILPDWEASVDLNISGANKFSTCVLPFDAEVPAGVHVFSASEYTGDALTLVEQGSFKAYTPYIIYAQNGYTGTLSGTVPAADYKEYVTDGLLSGAIALQEVSSGYVLQNQGSGAKFYKIPSAQSFTIPSGKCWAQIDNIEASALDVSFNPTAIKDSRKANVMAEGDYTIDGINSDGTIQKIIIKNRKKITQ